MHYINKQHEEFLDHLSTAYAAVCILLRNRHAAPEFKQTMEEAQKYFSTYHAVELGRIVGNHYQQIDLDLINLDKR